MRSGAGLRGLAQLRIQRVSAKPECLLTGAIEQGHFVVAEDAGNISDRVRQDAVERIVEKNGASEGVQVFGFETATLGLERAPLRPGRELARGDGGDEKRKKRDPILGILDVEEAHRREEEK